MSYFIDLSFFYFFCLNANVYVHVLLSYMLLELLKNSMRATVELHGVDNMPPIRIIIADGEDNEDVRFYSHYLLFFYYLSYHANLLETGDFEVLFDQHLIIIAVTI